MTPQFVYFSLIVRCGSYFRHTHALSTRTECHSASVGAYIGSDEMLGGKWFKFAIAKYPLLIGLDIGLDC